MCKRIFDILFSLVLLVLGFGIFGVIAFAIKISSSGNILYSQRRVGLKGETFKIFKFRTMVEKAEQMGSSITTRNDPRITPIGRLLRRFKLDELPQLWNVFKGEMGFVGPRPDIPEIVDTYSPEMRRILDVRPGITSIASLYLRDEEKLLASARDPDEVYEKILVPEKVKLAMQHVERNSFWFDLGILIRTIWAVTFGRMVPRSSENSFYQMLAGKINSYNSS